MTMQWITPRGSSEWISKSADGYYAISAPGPGQVEHQAFHIEAVWARPKEIGRATQLIDAQQLCERHNAAPQLAVDGMYRNRIG